MGNFSFREWTLLGVMFLGMGLSKSLAATQAPVLLTIDDSNPSAVVITATGTNSGMNFSGNTVNEGVDLLNFFSVDEFNMTFGQFLSGTLVGGNAGVSYNDVYSDDYSTSGGLSYFDAELYVDTTSPGSTSTQTFSTTSSAFTGTWTIDFSSLGIDASALPTPGTEGDILSGYNDDPGVIIGEWEVVTTATPEPASIGLLLLGAFTMVVVSYRRRSLSA